MNPDISLFGKHHSSLPLHHLRKLEKFQEKLSYLSWHICQRKPSILPSHMYSLCTDTSIRWGEYLHCRSRHAGRPYRKNERRSRISKPQTNLELSLSWFCRICNYFIITLLVLPWNRGIFCTIQTAFQALLPLVFSKILISGKKQNFFENYLLFPLGYAIMLKLSERYGGRQKNIRVWRSLVSRLNGVQEAAGSNPVTRTN